MLLANQNRPGGTFTNFWTDTSDGVVGASQELIMDGNVPATNLRVKFSNGGGKIYIYLRSR